MSSIYKRSDKNGVWYYQYYLDGKKHIKSLKTDDKSIAEKRAALIDVKRMQCSYGVNTSKTRLSLCLEKFLDHKKATLKTSTFKAYSNIVNQLQNFFRDVLVRKLTSDSINEYIQARKKQKRSGKTIHEELNILKTALNYAWSERLIDEIPIRTWPIIKKIPSKPETLGFYSLSDIQKLKNYFRGRAFEPIFLFALYTGCRRSEIANVKISDVDVYSQMIKIHNLKTESDVNNAFRYININDNLLPTIKSQIAKVKEGYLFPKFAKLSNSQAAKYIKKACKATGVTYKRFHGLRHTMATYLIASGMNLREVMAVMGWTELSTAERYTHVANMIKNRMNIVPF